MNRSRLALVSASVIAIATGCAGLIGVPDLTFDENATDGGPRADGTTPGNDGMVTGPDANAACNTDVSIDARNCGRCGHDCGAGACSGGVCQPFPLVDGVSVGSIAVDATYLYFADFGNGAIKQVNKNGSSAAPVNVAAVEEPIGVAVAGSLLYWTSRSGTPSEKAGLYRCTISAAGACTGAKQVSSHSYAQNVAVQGGNVFVATENGVFGSLPDGGDYLLKGSDGYNCFGVAASAGYVYYTSEANSVARSLADGGGVSAEDYVLVRSDSSTNYVAFDGDRAFYAAGDQGNGGTVASVLETNKGAVISYGDPTTYPVGIAADAQYVYWADRGALVGDQFSAPVANGSLFACPRGGCAGKAITLAIGLRGGGAITTDGGYVYFAENNNFQAGGRIRAVAKP